MSKLVLLRHGQSQWNLENRFTGWVDVDLTTQGRDEALAAGEKIKDVKFDLAFTSVLRRANETLQLALQSTGQTSLPVVKDQALNERHYGALQGLNKAETAAKFGEAQVKIWRRSFDVPPPAEKTDLNPEGISESLKDTAARTLPYFNSKIMPEIAAGKNVLVAAHGNSLRSIVMQLDEMTKEEVLELNIATGIPIVYEFSGATQVSKVIL